MTDTRGTVTHKLVLAALTVASMSCSTAENAPRDAGVTVRDFPEDPPRSELSEAGASRERAPCAVQVVWVGKGGRWLVPVELGIPCEGGLP